jgi:hypothetical protein
MRAGELDSEQFALPSIALRASTAPPSFNTTSYGWIPYLFSVKNPAFVQYRFGTRGTPFGMDLRYR